MICVSWCGQCQGNRASKHLRVMSLVKYCPKMGVSLFQSEYCLMITYWDSAEEIQTVYDFFRAYYYNKTDGELLSSVGAGVQGLIWYILVDISRLALHAYHRLRWRRIQILPLQVFCFVYLKYVDEFEVEIWGGACNLSTKIERKHLELSSESWKNKHGSVG